MTLNLVPTQPAAIEQALIDLTDDLPSAHPFSQAARADYTHYLQVLGDPARSCGEMAQVVQMSADLDDCAKVIGEFWAGVLSFDPTVPAAPVTLNRTHLSDAAASAGRSRRLGGIHFKRGDQRGRMLGHQVDQAVLHRCAQLFNDGRRCD